MSRVATCACNILAMAAAVASAKLADDDRLRASVTEQPELHWAGARSDWLNVKANPFANATGDGIQDDYAAIQAVLTNVTGGANQQVVYFPIGTYKISHTIKLGMLIGLQFLGHGRSTKIVWAGPQNGTMYHDEGCTKARYAGIHWDGMGVAGIGVLHQSAYYYETELHHESERFSGFTGAAVAFMINKSHPIAASEVMYRNTLFDNSAVGVLLEDFNVRPLICARFHPRALRTDETDGQQNNRACIGIAHCVCC